MDTANIIVHAVLIWTVAVLSPGPNFFVTARVAVVVSRKTAVLTVSGIATGTLIWGLSGFFGITFLFNTVPWLYIILKAVGGGYLIYLGIRLVIKKSAVPEPLQHETKLDVPTRRRAYRTGLLTAMSNPKAAAFAASLFAATMPANPPLSLGLTIVAIMTTMSWSWYAIVAVLFSSSRVTRLYQRFQLWIDRFAGLVFIGFGIKFAFRD